MSGYNNKGEKWVPKDQNQPRPQPKYDGQRENNQQQYRERSKEKERRRNDRIIEPKERNERRENGHSRQGSYVQGQTYNKTKDKIKRNPVARYQVKQVKDFENYRYDQKSLLNEFQECPEPPEELQELKQTFPQFFSKTPLQPLKLQQEAKQSQPTLHRATNTGHEQQRPSQNQYRKYSDSSDPEWMSESTTKIEDGGFQEMIFHDIESLLEEKRVQYQKEKGTYERKLKEKEEKQILKEQKEEEERELQQEKLKYKQAKEREYQQKQVQEQNDLFRLLGMKVQSGSQEITQTMRILTVEEIEQQYFQPQSQYDTDVKVSQSEPSRLEVDQSADYDAFLRASRSQPIESFQRDLWKPPVFQPQMTVPKQQMQTQSQPQPQAIPQQIISLEQLKKEPFSCFAVMNKRKINEPIWFYIDKIFKVQGGFPSIDMDNWYRAGYFMPTLNIAFSQPINWQTLDMFLYNLDTLAKGAIHSQRATEVPLMNTYMMQQMNMNTGLAQQNLQELFNTSYRQYSQPQPQAPNINIMNNVMYINPQNQQYLVNKQFPEQQSNQNHQKTRSQQQMTQQQQLHYQQQQYQMMAQQQQQQTALSQQQQSQQQQQNQKKLSKKEEEKASKEHLETMFNIGIRKQISQPQPGSSTNTTQADSGLVLDTKEFPALGEMKKEQSK